MPTGAKQAVVAFIWKRIERCPAYEACAPSMRLLSRGGRDTGQWETTTEYRDTAWISVFAADDHFVDDGPYVNHGRTSVVAPLVTCPLPCADLLWGDLHDGPLSADMRTVVEAWLGGHGVIQGATGCEVTRGAMHSDSVGPAYLIDTRFPGGAFSAAFWTTTSSTPLLYVASVVSGLTRAGRLIAL